MAAFAHLSKYRNSGQPCLSPTRFFVHQSIYAKFVKLFAERAESLKVGDRLDPTTQMGPLVNVRRAHAMTELVDACANSSRLVTGGRRLGEEGFFFAPTVLADTTDATPAMHQNPFGPIALMTPIASVEEAVARANASRYGLAAYVFTDSAKAQMTLLDKLEVGSIAVNSTVTSVSEAPFGGIKDSGYGYESGEEGLESYLHTKTVHRTYC